jgi:DNA-directed RNA polymerase specialized sigma24 family protein
VAGAKSQKELADARRAQAEFEETVSDARSARRKSFERARDAGFSLREIAEAVGLHRSRVDQIIKGK